MSAASYCDDNFHHIAGRKLSDRKTATRDNLSIAFQRDALTGQFKLID